MLAMKLLLLTSAARPYSLCRISFDSLFLLSKTAYRGSVTAKCVLVSMLFALRNGIIGKIHGTSAE